MSTFNLNHILSRYKLDEKMLAKELFPNNLHPEVAFKRITSGKAFLDTNQIDTLAHVIGVGVHDLFINDTWIMESQIRDNKVIFFRNTFRVELDLDTLVSRLYLAETLVAEETLILDKNIKLSEYLKLIDETVLNLI